ncbi:MAG: GAF and HD-GYP domain-containing protein, partial [bacterium]
MDYKKWACQFAEIGAEFGEKRTLSDILCIILTELRKLTGSDAGSIYRVVECGDDKCLKFELAQNDSIELPPHKDYVLEMNRHSLAGYVAVSGKILNIENVYELSEELPCQFDDSFDKQYNYRTKSVFVVPLRNRRGEIKGVLQLINRKKDYNKKCSETVILPYPDDMAELVPALASQAAVAMERAQLEESVQNMLDSIIQTLVEATDRRDRVTSGHSQRLAEYATKIADKINEIQSGPWREVKISDREKEALYYAGLLHDIGKLSVPESILNKENRLSDEAMEAIRYRFAYLSETGQIEDAGELIKIIEAINLAPYVEEKRLKLLKELHEKKIKKPDGTTANLLSAAEYEHLSVQKGNLTGREREIIEGHALASREILEGIEWTDELEIVPGLAGAHHEKINGTGYPLGLSGEEISLGARILAVVDIFEALTAQDRPYKPAKTVEEAQNILNAEVEAGAL